MEASSDRLTSRLVMFGRALRRQGIDVHPGRLLDVVNALAQVNIGARDEVFHTCRALLVHRHEHLHTFDRAFETFWFGGDEHRRQAPRPHEGRTLEAHSLVLNELGDVGDSHDSEDDKEVPRQHLFPTWSDMGVIANQDFATLTAAELADAAAALSRLAWAPGERRTRRWVRGRGTRIDLRRAIKQSVRTDGDVIRLEHRRRRVRARSLVLLCDISRSMERYSRMLLHFAHALATRQRLVEAFVFSTELTRITRYLRLRRADAALASVSQAVPDWSGGTRIGAAIREFHQQWGRRVLTGGPVVLLISDGWDCGDASELAAQIARLQRSAHRLIWLTPLLGTAGYAPLTRGLQAALPFVDDFLPIRTLTNLVDLAVHLNALP
jgi:uncharacterized protein with von Willebrand factor type A (vWA) domain